MQPVWDTITKPFFLLAPMDNVTDSVFRRIVIECGRPRIFFTEYTHVDDIFSKKNKLTYQHLLYTSQEKPLIIQLWGSKPELFYKAGALLSAMGFDGIDINMGCPGEKTCGMNGGGMLIKNPTLAKEIIQATKEGSQGLPVSVKTRIGFENATIDTWIRTILQSQPVALTVHLRTIKEQSLVPAHWECMHEIVALRNSVSKSTLLVGNGDIKNITEAKQKVKLYGIDGVLIGRGIFNNPWLFNRTLDFTKISPEQKIQTLKKHIDLFEETWQDKKDYTILKVYYKIYIKHFPGSESLLDTLIKTINYQEARDILSNFSLIDKVKKYDIQ